MHVVVTSFGSDGDFNPLLAIAGALVRRGVAVTFVANPFYERRVKSTGSRFVGAGNFLDIFAALRDRPRYLSTARGGVAIWKENVMVVPSAPYVRMFPAASVVVHHGGFGTCAEALRAGKPSLVIPFAFDQFDTAARVHDAGLGRWLVGKANSAGAMAATLDSILRSAPLTAAARDAAAKIAAVPAGADRAAELIAAL